MRLVLLPLGFAVVFASMGMQCIASDPEPAAGTGGATSSGGAPGTGGKVGTGGATSKGGAPGTGGAPSTGGSSQPPAAVDCPDTSTFSNQITGQYGGTQITVDGNPNKTYFMQANWWGTPWGSETESVSGIGFTMTNPNNTITSNPNLPLGFPSILIGSYQTKKTTGSNLPKQVSALTSIPTIFSTNTDQKGYTSYNAAYDVWFTQSSALVTGSDPGSGGAYLMVWLFKPTDKSPRGTIKTNGSVVNGVPGAWDIWYDATNPPCVSYVSNPDKLASIEFDLNYFIKDAVAKNYGVTNSQYLSIIFAGFEVWGGGSGLQVKKFCANVK